MVSNADVRRQRLRHGHLRRRVPGADRRPQPTAGQLRHQRAVPARLHVQARDGLAARWRTADHAADTARRPPAISDRPVPVLRLEPPGFGPLDIYDGFAHSSDTFFYQVAGELGIDRLGVLGAPVGLRRSKTGIDLPAEARGIVPTNEWKQNVFKPADLPGRGLPGGYRPGLRRGHAAAAPQRLQRAGQRRHAVSSRRSCAAFWRPTAPSCRTSSPS